jgi:hypothetical protein
VTTVYPGAPRSLQNFQSRLKALYIVSRSFSSLMVHGAVCCGLSVVAYLLWHGEIGQGSHKDDVDYHCTIHCWWSLYLMVLGLWSLCCLGCSAACCTIRVQDPLVVRTSGEARHLCVTMHSGRGEHEGCRNKLSKVQNTSLSEIAQ